MPYNSNLTTEAEIFNLDFEINFSLQVGDQLYWNEISSQLGGFINYQNTILLGEVTEISKDEDTGANIIGFNFTGVTPSIPSSTVSNIITNLPSISGFITFKKNPNVNNASLKGYYAAVKFVNSDYNSRNELFSISSEISLSSK